MNFGPNGQTACRLFLPLSSLRLPFDFAFGLLFFGLSSSTSSDFCPPPSFPPFILPIISCAINSATLNIDYLFKNYTKFSDHFWDLIIHCGGGGILLLTTALLPATLLGNIQSGWARSLTLLATLLSPALLPLSTTLLWNIQPWGTSILTSIPLGQLNLDGWPASASTIPTTSSTTASTIATTTLAKNNHWKGEKCQEYEENGWPSNK